MSHDLNRLEPLSIDRFAAACTEPHSAPSGAPRETSFESSAADTRDGVCNVDLVPAEKYGTRGAYEIKFLINETQSQGVREWARIHLQPDPHAAIEDGESYWVNSLYLDTPRFDVFHRTEICRQRKYRLRRYGSEASIWMELKRKLKGRVRKRRTRIADADVPNKLLAADTTPWDGLWYQQRIAELQLRPICQVTYQRFACVGNSAFGPVRLTVDSQLRSQPADGWKVPSAPLNSGLLLPRQQILELKFRETLPTTFRDLIHEQNLIMGTFSKYRQSVEACISMDRLMGGMPLE